MTINNNQRVQLVESPSFNNDVLNNFKQFGIIYLIINDITTGELISVNTFNLADGGIYNNYFFISQDDNNKYTLTFNPGMFFRNIGIIDGSYNYEFKFTIPKLGNSTRNYVINRISTSRLEVEIVEPDINKTEEDLQLDNLISNKEFKAFINNNDTPLNDTISKLKTYINFGNINSFLIVNSYYYQYKLYLKLYEPLSEEVDNYSRFIIEEDIINSIRGDITLYTESELLKELVDDIPAVFTNPIPADETELLNYTILKQNSISTNEHLNYNISSSLEGISLNTDYRIFNRFIHYSTSVNRIQNFKTKIQSIEYYNSKIDEYNATTDAPVYATSSVNYYTNLKNDILMSFDSFEKYLYYQSASNVDIDEFYSSSNEPVQFVVQPWPKSNSSKPYTLYYSTSSQVTNWYNELITESEIYDNKNPDKLTNFIPMEIRNNVFNEPYVKLINMVSHFFDTRYNYIKEMTSINRIHPDINKGIPKDLIISRLNHFGFDAKSGFSTMPFNVTTPISQSI